jgi:hypothetical protein
MLSGFSNMLGKSYLSESSSDNLFPGDTKTLSVSVAQKYQLLPFGAHEESGLQFRAKRRIKPS